MKWNIFYYSKNTSTSDFDIGLFFIYGDESIPNHAKDYSIVFPIQHVANGLTINFKPKPEPAHSSHWIELVHPDWFVKSKKEHKGQLISKCPFVVIVWTKIPTKFFPGFLP